jgi:hypothetical protein
VNDLLAGIANEREQGRLQQPERLLRPRG